MPLTPVLRRVFGVLCLAPVLRRIFRNLTLGRSSEENLGGSCLVHFSQENCQDKAYFVYSEPHLPFLRKPGAWAPAPFTKENWGNSGPQIYCLSQGVFGEHRLPQLNIFGGHALFCPCLRSPRGFVLLVFVSEDNLGNTYLVYPLNQRRNWGLQVPLFSPERNSWRLIPPHPFY